jgi:hypothetical protein
MLELLFLQPVVMQGQAVLVVLVVLVLLVVPVVTVLLVVSPIVVV